MKILVLNGGSSTFKCWFHDVREPLPVEAPQPEWETHIEWDPQKPLAEQLDPVLAGKQPEVVGHRIVHGGNARVTTLITPQLRSAIAREAEFAPSHNRFELEAIEAIDHLLGPPTRQIAVFDTAFHATLDPAAYTYPGPYAWLEQGVRRYGFHGISYQYATRRAAHLLGQPAESLRLILCHLGNGASLAAVRNGKSIDTTMGFTPLEGLMMGTRSGSIDPGILVYLLRHCGYTADQLDRILNRESGLKGISGVSGDMREILSAVAGGNPRAQLAFDIYAHRVVREAGAMLAVLGGMDALVFTGGVGENCFPLRDRVRSQLSAIGLQFPVLVIHAQEEWEIARECYELLTSSR